MYDIKALYEAESVEHAIQLLVEHPKAQIIAGGSDVLVQMREGKRAGKELVSIYGIDDPYWLSYQLFPYYQRPDYSKTYQRIGGSRRYGRRPANPQYRDNRG